MAKAKTLEQPPRSAFLPPELTLNDRCDICRAEAQTRVVIPTPTQAKYKAHTKEHKHTEVHLMDRDSYDILLCGHHTNTHKVKLEDLKAVFHYKAVVVHDRTKGSDH